MSKVKKPGTSAVRPTDWGALVKGTETARVCADPQTQGERLIAAYGRRTPETAAAILGLMAEGADLAQAAGAVGVAPSTLTDWRRDDPKFAELIQRARAISLSQAQIHVFQAGARDWRAAAHRLAKAPETREVWGDRISAADVQINVVVNVARATSAAIADAQSMVDVTPVTAASDLTPGNL